MNCCRETTKMGVPQDNRPAVPRDWFRGVPNRYVAGADTRGRPEGRPYPWSQQVIHVISGLRQLPVAVDPRRFVGEPGSLNVNLCRLLAEILADGFFQTFHLNQATGLGKSTK